MRKCRQLQIARILPVTEKKPPETPPQVNPPLTENLTPAEIEALERDAIETREFALKAFKLPPHTK